MFFFKPKQYDYECADQITPPRPPKDTHSPARPPKPLSYSPTPFDGEKGDAPVVPPRRRNSPLFGGMETFADRISPNGVVSESDQAQPSVLVGNNMDGDTPKGSPLLPKRNMAPPSDHAATALPKRALSVRIFLLMYFYF